MKTGIFLILTLFGFARLMAQPSGSQKTLVPVISKNGNTEFSPTISADGRTLIYETQRDDKWELYQSNRNDKGEWTEPVALKSINEKCQFIAGPSLSYDGNTLYYTAFIEGVTKSEDIFYSIRIHQDEWSEPKSLGIPVNTGEEYEGFPSISSDGSSLYFIRVNPENTYDKKAKETCFSIYVSHKKADGAWGEPMALPKEVNSGCERDPRIMADNHTLIFSSIRNGGKGKYDLYQTRLTHDGSWTTPVALNFVNSAENDQSPCISASGTTMFYYSDNDIYEIPIPQEYRQLINITVQGAVVSAKTNLPIEAKIVVRNLTTGESFASASNASDGRYSLVLAAGGKYEITFAHPQHVAGKVRMDYSGQQTYLEKKMDVKLESEWRLSVMVKDKELGHPVTALFKITGPGGTKIAQDSIKNTSLPAVFDLETQHEYQLGVYAPGYAPLEKKVAFNGDTATEVRMIELLEPVKVSVVADVTDIVSGEKKRLKVTYSNENRDEVIVADAGQTVHLRKGDRYQVVTNSDRGYAYAMRTVVAGESASTGRPATIALPVTSLQPGAKLTLNHIYFESNSWTLNSASALELSNIAELLRRNPNVTIEISAHTDDVGSDDFNQDLSQKRAMSVTAHLHKVGIPLHQLVAKGYGKSRPFVTNDSDENRAKNRRVELLVLEVK